VTPRSTLLGLAALLLAAALAFHLFSRRLGGVWLAFGLHPEALAVIESSLADQRRLAQLDPARAAEYRRRFEEVRALDARLKVVGYNQQRIARRYQTVVLVGFALVVGSAAGAAALRQARQARRFERLQGALADLAAGRTDLVVGERGGDAVGRVAAMVERASRVMARDRRRLASLEHLSAWQEAARRHAHELRTPLTAARLELGRLADALDAAGEPALRAELRRRHDGLAAELDRLERFTRSFTSFAALAPPSPVDQDLAALLAAFVELFAPAWPGMALRLDPRSPQPSPRARVDGEALRQVLVNLCDNSARALREAGRTRGALTLTAGRFERWIALEVADDGPGIESALVPRLFQPYASGRRPGEGMGLGLAISRKLLLDQGGDLELLRTSPAGTTFRLLLPPAEDPA
jgi:signal transduction histidine kinase